MRCAPKTDLAVVVEVVPDEEVADGHPHLFVRPLHAAVPTVSAGFKYSYHGFFKLTN